VWIDQRGSEILTPAECARLLALSAKRGVVGRLAVSTEAAPVVQPVNFTYHDETVFVKLGEGFMVEAASGALVAFEVDLIDSETAQGWSVLVRGLASELSTNDSAQLDGKLPSPLVPVPGVRVLALRADIVTGRRFAVEDREARETR
jgi:hypothetical protein